MRDFAISGRPIGPGHPCYIIAEAGVNHNGEIALARQLIDVAVAVGADAVKFQTFKAELVMTASAPKADYQLGTTNPDESQLEMARSLELPFEAFQELQVYSTERGITFLSSPFDAESIAFLDALDCPAIKIPSGELTSFPFLEQIARTGRPVILSTGMANLAEVDEAVRTLYSHGCSHLALLHCTTSYPSDPDDANLRVIDTLAAAFQLPVGYSDHTPSNEVSLAAVARGASIIERHFTLDNELPGPDHKASLNPAALLAQIDGIRLVERALGDGLKRPTAAETANIPIARRSLVATGPIPRGTMLTNAHVAIKRPGTGLPPAFLPHLIGHTVQRDIAADELFELAMFMPFERNIKDTYESIY